MRRSQLLTGFVGIAACAAVIERFRTSSRMLPCQRNSDGRWWTWAFQMGPLGFTNASLRLASRSSWFYSKRTWM